MDTYWYNIILQFISWIQTWCITYDGEEWTLLSYSKGQHTNSGRWSHLVGLGWAYWISCGRWSQLRDSWCVVAYTHKVDWHVRSHYMSYLVKCDIYLGCVMWNVTHWIFGSKYTFGSWFSIVDNRTGHYPFWDFNYKLKFGAWGDITCQLI